MKALFIVDMQLEFVDDIPYLDKSILINTILAKIKEYRDKDLPIITTTDSHTEKHYEFLKHGEHCIAGSDGGLIYFPILKALTEYHKWYDTPKNQYSAFVGDSKASMENILQNMNIDSAEVCGVLTSICVLNLTLDLVNRQIPVNIIPGGTFDYNDKNKKALIIMKDWVGVTNE